MKGLTKEHVYTTHRHRQQCGHGQKEGGRAEAEWRQAKSGVMGISVRVPTTKIKIKKKSSYFCPPHLAITTERKNRRDRKCGLN